VAASKLVREKDVEAYLVRGVRQRGGLCLKWTSPGLVGVPDRIVFLDGYITFVELKAPRGRLSAAQRRMMVLLQAQGARTAVLNNYLDVDIFLSAHPCL